MVAAAETRPWLSRNARSVMLASRWLSENDTSPPRITRPSRASPSPRLRANEPTPAMAATPSAMHEMNTAKPRSPPRISRSAKRRMSQPAGFVAIAVMPEPSLRGLHYGAVIARLGREVDEQKVRQQEDDRQRDHQTGNPDVRVNPGLRRKIARPPHIVDVHRRQARVGARRRHQEETHQQQDPGEAGPGRQAAPVIADLPHQIDEHERQPAVKQREAAQEQR